MEKYNGSRAVFEDEYEEGLEKAYRRYAEAEIKYLLYTGMVHVFDVIRNITKIPILILSCRLNLKRMKGIYSEPKTI